MSCLLNKVECLQRIMHVFIDSETPIYPQKQLECVRQAYQIALLGWPELTDQLAPLEANIGLNVELACYRKAFKQIFQEDLNQTLADTLWKRWNDHPWLSCGNEYCPKTLHSYRHGVRSFAANPMIFLEAICGHRLNWHA